MVHHYNWGLPVAVDLFAAAMGAGAFMLAAVADLTGGKKYRTTSFISAIIAPWPAIIGVLLLVIDLGNPMRFWELLLKVSPDGGLEAPFLMFNLTSTMSIGTWTLTFFVWISLAYILCHILSYPFPVVTFLRKLIGAAGIPIALMVTIYTGILLSASPNNVWNNGVLPIVFVASALATGIASVVVVLAFMRMLGTLDEFGADIPKLEFMMAKILIIQIVALVIFMLAGFSNTLSYMFKGNLSATLWIMLLAVGLVVPLLLTVKGKQWLMATAAVSILLVVEGVLFLKQVLTTNSMVVPIVFFLSAMVAGIVTELVVLSILKTMGMLRENKTQMSLVGVVITRIMLIQVAVVAIVMIAGASFPAMANMQLGAILWVFVIGLGLIVPAMVIMKGKSWQPATSLVTAMLVLEGGFFLRYVLLIAGQMQH